MARDAKEWLRQADYDMETAQAMFDSGRYFYAVFMCHLSIEKVLKGFYQEQENKMPPKIHNLIYFVEKLHLDLPENLLKFVAMLNDVSIPTRYPETLDRLVKEFQSKRVHEILKSGKELLEWAKKKFSMQ